MQTTLEQAIAERDAAIEQVQYRDIPAYPGYRAGDDGSIWSCHPRIGRPPKNKPLQDTWFRMKTNSRNGYLHVVLYSNGTPRTKRVQRLVLEAFVGPPPTPTHQAAHNNNVREDCRLANLRWDTPVGNMGDRERHGTRLIGEKNPFAKLTREIVRAIRKACISGESQRSVASRFGLTQATVNYIHLRKAWGWLPD